MFAASLHAVRRDGPRLGFKIDLNPTGLENFAGTGCGQNQNSNATFTEIPAPP